MWRIAYVSDGKRRIRTFPSWLAAMAWHCQHGGEWL